MMDMQQTMDDERYIEVIQWCTGKVSEFTWYGFETAFGQFKHSLSLDTVVSTNLYRLRYPEPYEWRAMLKALEYQEMRETVC